MMEFSLIDMRMAGVPDGKSEMAAVLEKVMCSILSEEHIVSKGENGASWVHFIIGAGSEGIEEVLRGVQERFSEACRRSGEQVIPSLRWETRYSRVMGECVSESEILDI
jgi:hypothetical protein